MMAEVVSCIALQMAGGKRERRGRCIVPGIGGRACHAWASHLGDARRLGSIWAKHVGQSTPGPLGAYLLRSSSSLHVVRRHGHRWLWRPAALPWASPPPLPLSVDLPRPMAGNWALDLQQPTATHSTLQHPTAPYSTHRRWPAHPLRNRAPGMKRSARTCAPAGCCPHGSGPEMGYCVPRARGKHQMPCRGRSFSNWVPCLSLNSPRPNL